jgi:hypothetical protein
MRYVLVRYRVKPGRSEENEALSRAVYEELSRARPAGLGYATFKLPDGVSFVHLSASEGENGNTPLTELPAFKRFVADIAERCDEPPVVSEVSEVGAFALFGR